MGSPLPLITSPQAFGEFVGDYHPRFTTSPTRWLLQKDHASRKAESTLGYPSAYGFGMGLRYLKRNRVRPVKADIGRVSRDIRFGSEADIASDFSDVR